jgi:hypothetical protein
MTSVKWIGDDLAAGGADGLQRSEIEPLGLDEAAHRIGDADAADQQRGQADQGEKLGEALDDCAGSSARRWRASGSPSRHRVAARHGLRARRSAASVARRSSGRTDAGGPAHQAARLEQARRAEGVLGEDQARAEADAGGDLVGLGDEIDAAVAPGR